MRKTALLFAICCLSITAFSQGAPQKPLRIGIGLLGSGYSGDLAAGQEKFTRFYPGVAASFQFVSEKLISPQFSAGFGRFVAQDRDLAAVDGIQPNTFVSTPFFFIDFRLKARFMRQSRFVPYISAGIGMLGYTPKDMNGSNLVDNVGTRGEEEIYGSITASFPLSAGFEIRMNHLMALGLEYSFRPTGSDYLDNVGALGQVAGKDKLHTLLMSLYFTIDPGKTLQEDNTGRGRDRR